VLVAAAALALAGAGVATAGTSRHTLQEGLDDLRTLGVVGAQGRVAVGHRDVVARSGVADRRTNAPMPRDGHFRMGSNTKTFVAVVILQLVGEGRLSLDDTVERWLPGVVAGNGNDGSGITVRQLLQQTSGLYNFTFDLPVLSSAEGYLEHRLDHYDDEDLVAIALRHPPVFAPGTRWEYSNTNYALAGMVIEAVTGTPWETQVRSRILGPLGMRDTSYPGDRPFLPRPSARTYQQFTAGGPVIDVSVFNPTSVGAVGGMVSTTDDLVRFWRALQRGELLEPQQLAEMRRTVPADQETLPGLRYGLGIVWVPNRCGGYWGHPGDLPGVSTMNAVTTNGDRAAVVYRTTSLADPAVDSAMYQRVFRLMDDLICE
jgi:D-alanyl-D-alanine carboxypeptidase